MPPQHCTMNGKPGWKWGDAGKCYPYAAGDEAASAAAEKKAVAQGVAAGGGTLAESRQLLEVTTSPNLKVDTEGGVIRGVKILGRVSANDRVYSQAAIRQARNLYEGTQVKFDHPSTKGRAGLRRPERSIDDTAGWLEQVIVDGEGGLTGNLHLLRADPRSAKVLEAAERRPQLFGMSHDAEGRVERHGDKQIVEEIEALHSVDIVSDPATTRSLFESIQVKEAEMPNDTLPTEMATEVPTQVEVETPEVDSTDAVKKSFEQAMTTILKDPELDKAAKVAKIKALLDQEEKAVDLLGTDEATTEVTTEVTTESKIATESPELVKLRGKVDRLENQATARRLLEAKGIRPDDGRVLALSRMVNEQERGALLETWPQDSGKKEKPRGGSVLTESANDGYAKTHTAEEFTHIVTN